MKYRDGSIWRVISKEVWGGKTVREALSEGGKTVRKLLVNGEYAKGAKRRRLDADERRAALAGHTKEIGLTIDEGAVVVARGANEAVRVQLGAGQPAVLTRNQARRLAEQLLEVTSRPKSLEAARVRRDEARVLSAIGESLADFVPPEVSVRIPRALGEQAVQAWERDDLGFDSGETLAEEIDRDRAGALMLIGLAISRGGVTTGDWIEVNLGVEPVVKAIQAAEVASPG